MIQIKICGITTKAEIDAVNRCRPDYIGFVFAESRRRVIYEQARDLKRQLDSGIHTVGVFVNEPVDSIRNLVHEGIIDLIQLHGEEDEAYIHSLKHEVVCPVIKAVRVRNTEQIINASRLPCDILLLDSFHKDFYGGSGKSFDHRLIPPLTKPFFLAGGLHAGNIGPCIVQWDPFGVDISSGVETDGKKDEVKIRQIIDIVNKLNERKRCID